MEYESGDRDGRGAWPRSRGGDRVARHGATVIVNDVGHRVGRRRDVSPAQEV